MEKQDIKSWPLVRQINYIQNKLEVPKTQENEEAGFTFRNIEDILSRLKPLRAETGCIITFSEEVELHGGARYIASTATIANQSGETMSSKALAREDEALPGKCQAQITGACTSYARKYAIGGLLAIDAGRQGDIDAISPSEAAHGEKSTTTKPVLRKGMQGWTEETSKLEHWKGTQDGYIADLKNRYEIGDIDLAILLSKRAIPFAGNKAEA